MDWSRGEVPAAIDVDALRCVPLNGLLASNSPNRLSFREPGTHMVLPLPLVPIEEHMFLDDRPAYPMNIFARLRFSGRVDREAFESAARTALARHPMLRAMVREAGRGNYEWVESEDTTSIVRYLPRPTEDVYPHMKGIDIRRERGVAICVLEAADATDVVVQMHHASADGLGGFIFVRDLIAAYAVEKKAAKRHALRRLDPEGLRKRGEFGLTKRKLLGMAHRQARGLIGAAQFYFRNAAPIVPHSPQPADSPLPPEYPAARFAEFTEDESAAYLRAAELGGVTTNDLLCRDLFLALAQWREEHKRGDSNDWLRMKVPVNLRTVADRRLPAANVVSAIFLDRRGADFSDPAKLLKSIHDQMQIIKRNQLGLTLVLSFRLQKKLPGGLRSTVRPDKISATCIATNLGEVLAKTPVPTMNGRLVAGNLTLESFECLPPLRPHTAAAFTLFRYAGRQCVSLHYDPRVLTAEEAQDLLDAYAARVRDTVASVPREAIFAGPAPVEAAEGDYAE